MSASDLSTPDIRTSGVSLTVQQELEELHRQAEHHTVSPHTDIINVLDQYGGLIPKHTHRDISNRTNRGTQYDDSRLLLYYCDQISQHWTVIDSAASAFFRSIDRRQPPKVFMMHSQFVILAGRKMSYLGDLLVRSLHGVDTKQWVESYSNRLCEVLKASVRATRKAALNYPSVGDQQVMVDSVKDVTDWALDLKDMVFRLAYLSRSIQMAGI
jgi:hypothetical protein